jgi:DNA-binding GntR family transcriptional regulator
MTDTIREHQQLLEKIKAQDFKGLDCLIEHHLTIAQDINLELLDKQSAKRGLL